MTDARTPISEKATKIVKSPWTAEQVDALNRFQIESYAHPFTCPGHEGGGNRDLIATRRGWICCHCDYTQDWAHECMVKISSLEHHRGRP